MKLLLTTFILPLVINSCQSGTTKPETTAVEASTANTAEPLIAPPDFPMTPDTIEVRGKFQQGCDMPRMIKIAEHNELSAPWKEIAVNASGEFVYRTYLTEPRRIAMRTEKKANYDFIATTNEKIYQVDINCFNKVEKLELKGSAENTAYHPYALANRKFRNEIDSFARQDISNPEVFAKLKNKITEYQKSIDGIASANPATFTAKVLIASEKLPEGSLNSAESLRKNWLQREAFANPQLYNDFQGGRILSNYLAICDRKADQFEVVDRLMKIGVKNPEAAKRLQQVAYNNFYNRHEEELVIAYIKWADANPTAMYNQSVKMQLAKLKKVMPGSQLIDITLNDPKGTPKKLSDVVNSAKLTLLIFYSPTCDHCQLEIPQLKPIWDQYKSKGLKIYIIGFDATAEEWAWFIKNKSYPEWTHVFEYPGYHPSDIYVVNYTPTFILIDSQGKIITRLPELEDVKSDIPRLLQPLS